MTETEIVAICAPPDPRQPGQPDGRGRGRARRRRASAARRCRPGASTGAREAIELRDGDRRGLWRQGRAARRSTRSTASLPTCCSGATRPTSRRSTRRMIELDGTANKSRLGANAILGVSLALAKAAAAQLGLPLYRYVGGASARTLPVPMMNVINGGAHADNPIDLQEFMIMPVGAPTFAEALRIGRRGLPRAQARASRTPATTPMSATRAASRRTSKSADEALGFLASRSRRPATGSGEQVVFALDPAASEFHRGGKYELAGEGQLARCRRHGAVLRGARARATRSSRSRTAWPRTTGTAGRR